MYEVEKANSYINSLPYISGHLQKWLFKWRTI